MKSKKSSGHKGSKKPKVIEQPMKVKQQPSKNLFRPSPVQDMLQQQSQQSQQQRYQQQSQDEGNPMYKCGGTMKYWDGGVNYINNKPQIQGYDAPKVSVDEMQQHFNQQSQNPNIASYSQGNVNSNSKSQQRVGQSPTMKKVGSIGGAIGSGYYSSQQPSNLPSAQGEQGYNTAMAGISQAGPIGGVIGGVSAIGDSIGKPIREHAERIDSNTGGYQDISGARQYAVIGGLFNPFKALMEHPNYKKLDQKMRYQKQVGDWNKSLAVSSAYRQNNEDQDYQPTFAYGGLAWMPSNIQPREYAQGGRYYAGGGDGSGNAELEDDEIFRTPDGEMDKVNGRTHAEGGEQYNLPQNTEILGKNIAPNGISYKENGDKLMRQYSKYTKILENKPTALAKKTASMMLDKVQGNYTNLMNTQEAEKQQQINQQMFAYGGLTKYPTGGTSTGVFSGITPGPTSKYSSPEQDWNYGNYVKGLNSYGSTTGYGSVGKQRVNDTAELYYYSNLLNKKLSEKNPEKNPELYQNLMSKYGYNANAGFGKNMSAKTRTTGAEEYAKQYPDFYLSPEEQKGILGDKFDKYSQLRGTYGKELNLIGPGEDPNKPETWKVGARHAVAFNPGEYGMTALPPDKNTLNIPESDFSYKVNYDPTQANPYQEDLTYMTQPVKKSTGGYMYPYGGTYGENMEQYSQGGIHIKPQNKGKFTAYKQRTGKTTTEALNSSDPHVRQMANFARNASKWKHSDGGVNPYKLTENVYAHGGVEDDPAPLPIQPRGTYMNGDIQPIDDSRYMQQSGQGIPQEYRMYQPNRNVPTEGSGYNFGDTLNTIGQYAPIAYNLSQGLFGKAENVNPQDYYNPYENQVMSMMGKRRYNIDPELESNRLATANYYQNLRQGAPSQGRYLAGLQAGSTAQQRANAEAIARKQNIDNQYRGEEANTLSGFGQQRAATNFQVADINVRNKAAQRAYLPAALTQLQQQLQVNAVMKQQKKKQQNDIERDNERMKLLHEYFKNYNFNLGF
jgi:hypothetical protein